MIVDQHAVTARSIAKPQWFDFGCDAGPDEYYVDSDPFAID